MTENSRVTDRETQSGDFCAASAVRYVCKAGHLESQTNPPTKSTTTEEGNALACLGGIIYGGNNKKTMF